MLRAIGRYFIGRATRGEFLGTAYALARSLLAASSLLTLLVNPADVFFRPVMGLLNAPICTQAVSSVSLFCVFRDHLELARWIAIVCLALAASGWRPRVTGILHFWAAYSFQASAISIDGGDQIASNLALLLLPVTLVDGRRFHWQIGTMSGGVGGGLKEAVVVASLFAVRLQMAAIYLHSAVGKLGVEEWRDGTALYYYLSSPDIGAPRNLMTLLLPMLSWGLPMALITWGSILVEIYLFLCLVGDERFRRIGFVIGSVFHVGIAVLLGLPSFSLIMIAALILYLLPLRESGAVYSYTLGAWGAGRHAAKLEDGSPVREAVV